MKEFTLSVIAGAHMKGNGNRRDANGMFTTKQPIIISNFASDMNSPALPKELFLDVNKTFLENHNDAGIDLGQSDVIYYNQAQKNQFSSATNDFILAFKEYAAKKLIAFNEGHISKKNKILNYKDVHVQIIRYRNNNRTNVGGLSGHHDPHYVGSLIWVIEETGCEATFQYREKENGEWLTISKIDGYTFQGELMMINNLYHRVLVEPDAGSVTWSRIIITVFL